MQDKLINIRQLPVNLLTYLDKLIVNRIGNNNEATMITSDISGHVVPEKVYQFSFENGSPKLLLVEKMKPLNTPDISKNPMYAVLKGNWLHSESTSNLGANILGGFGALIVEGDDDVVIPVINATKENLSFYNALLLSPGDTIQFETKHNLPITEVSVGRNYVNDYLAVENHGGGEYIEYHDQPHLWAPKSLDCSGYILLGRQDRESFYLTGFRIPFGTAVYLSPYTLHADSYLVGDYQVVYTVTENYSTVIFKNTENKIKRLKFA